VGRLLRKIGLSPQRPLRRATQQDPERVTRWKTEQYPAIRAEAAQLGATIYVADEAGIRSDYHAGTTWAPFGQTPIVRTTGARHSINMISAVTANGAMHFTTFSGKMDAAVFIDYCRDLLHDDGVVAVRGLGGSKPAPGSTPRRAAPGFPVAARRTRRARLRAPGSARAVAVASRPGRRRVPAPPGKRTPHGSGAQATGGNSTRR